MGTGNASTTPSGDPRTDVVSAYDAIAKIAMDAKDQQTLTKNIRATLEVLIDFERFSKRTIKSAWPDLSSRDRKRFQTLFKRLIIQTYAKRFKPGSSFTVSYRADTQFKKEEATVPTTVHGEKIAVDVTYVFHWVTSPSSSGWKAYDLEIDEVSMALNWRRQFTRILTRDGFEALLKKIERRVSQTGG